MSYCRWSSDDFRCDLYVYEASDGVVIHVAGRRHSLTDDGSPAPVAWLGNNVTAWLARHHAVMELVDKAPKADIGLPHDGESFYGLSYPEAAERVRDLIRVGYRCDPSVAEELEAEASASEAGQP